MAKNEEDKWITQMFVFPEEGEGDYEHDEPYEVQYTADGDRRTRTLSQDQIDEVRQVNGLPNEEVRQDENDGEE